MTVYTVTTHTSFLCKVTFAFYFEILIFFIEI